MSASGSGGPAPTVAPTPTTPRVDNSGPGSVNDDHGGSDDHSSGSGSHGGEDD